MWRYILTFFTVSLFTILITNIANAHSGGTNASGRNLNQGAAQPNLNTDIVKHIVVPFPPEDEQVQIVDVLERTLHLERMTYSTIDIEMLYNQLEKSILSKAFSGKLGTNDPKEESAKELLKEVLKDQRD
ncbi:restriction endonuclease subunit S [Bacillus pinisoli]|uniref:restriction endonuclease subunit S n=1 Tax=Bacillus pinisoli TaxID=2901866 RepID=UPI001FF2C7B2